MTFEQLTTAARLRRESAFWRESHQTATRKHDQDVLESLYRAVTARIIALKMIPDRWSLLCMLAAMNGLALIYLAANAVGNILPDPISWDSLWALPDIDPAVLIASPVVTFAGLVGVASVYVRRRRVIRLYLDGEDVSGLPLEFTDADIKVGFHLTLWQCAALVSLSIGLCGTTGMIGFGVGAGMENVGMVQPWVTVWFLASMLLLVCGFSVIPPLYHQEREHPVHPRPMKPKACVPPSSSSTAASLEQLGTGGLTPTVTARILGRIRKRG